MRIGIQCGRRDQALGAVARSVAIGLLCMQLAACSSYEGPITNAAPPAGSEGPPLLTGGYAP